MTATVGFSFCCRTPILATTTSVVYELAYLEAPRANARTAGLRPDQWGNRPHSDNGNYARASVIVRSDDEILSEWATLGGLLGEGAAAHLTDLMAAEKRRLDAWAWYRAAPQAVWSTRDATGARVDVPMAEITAACNEQARRRDAAEAAEKAVNSMANARGWLVEWSGQGAGRTQWQRYTTAHAAGLAAGLDLPALVEWVTPAMEAALEAAFPGAKWRFVDMEWWQVVTADLRTFGGDPDPGESLAHAMDMWARGQEWLRHVTKTGRLHQPSPWERAGMSAPNVKHGAAACGLRETEVIAACAGLTEAEVIASGEGYGVLEHVATYGRCPSGPVGPYYHWARKAA